MRHNSLRFDFLTGDCNWQVYGGKFISEKTFTQSDWPFKALIDVCNLQESGMDNMPMYQVSLSAISIDAAGPEELKHAMTSQSMPELFNENASDSLKYEALANYGIFSTLWTGTGNNIKQLMREAHEQAAILCGMFFGFAMDRVQNGLGNTGWDFISGQIGYGHHYEDIHPEVDA